MSKSFAHKLAASEARINKKLDQLLEKREAPRPLFAYNKEDIEDMAARARYTFIQKAHGRDPMWIWDEIDPVSKDAWIAVVNEVLYGSSC